LEKFAAEMEFCKIGPSGRCLPTLVRPLGSSEVVLPFESSTSTEAAASCWPSPDMKLSRLLSAMLCLASWDQCYNFVNIFAHKSGKNLEILYSKYSFMFKHKK
jgi:hypothetical protein